MQSQSITPSVVYPTNVKEDGALFIAELTGQNAGAEPTAVNPRQGIEGFPARMRGELGQAQADWARAGASLRIYLT